MAMKYTRCMAVRGLELGALAICGAVIPPDLRREKGRVLAQGGNIYADVLHRAPFYSSVHNAEMHNRLSQNTKDVPNSEWNQHSHTPLNSVLN